jgi:hypothetical protein
MKGIGRVLGGIDFTSFYDFFIEFWNYSDSVVFLLFILSVIRKHFTCLLLEYISYHSDLEVVWGYCSFEVFKSCLVT